MRSLEWSSTALFSRLRAAATSSGMYLSETHAAAGPKTVAQRRAPCILIEGRRPPCPQMARSKRPETLSWQCSSAEDCHRGYCDESIGQCICAPGWAGAKCDWSFISACRMHEHSTHMTCSGFTGIMSCECFDQCVASMGASAVSRKICFERKDGLRSNVSDIPADLSAVRFFADKDVSARSWVGVPLQSPAAASHHWSWRSVQLLEPRGDAPLPVDRCPGACSHVGTCIGSKRGSVPRCQCHLGFHGSACNISDSSFCMNGCTGRGRCINQFCLCEPGWFGVDCSLQRHQQRPQTRERPRGVYAPMFVYPLPSEWSWQFVHQNAPFKRGLFSAGHVFIEQLHARRESMVSDPELAALFLVPVLPNYIGGNLWDPRQFLSLVVTYIATKYPYWNRMKGADHVFLTTQARRDLTLVADRLKPFNPFARACRTWGAAGHQLQCTIRSSCLTLGLWRASMCGQILLPGPTPGRAAHVYTRIETPRRVAMILLRMWWRLYSSASRPASLTE